LPAKNSRVNAGRHRRKIVRGTLKALRRASQGCRAEAGIITARSISCAAARTQTPHRRSIEPVCPRFIKLRRRRRSGAACLSMLVRRT
jgi:hypothetical protein